MRRFPQAELHFVNKEMETHLGQGNFIFVGSSTDMWANIVDSSWLFQVLVHCKGFDNKYLFQSKNPERFRYFTFPTDAILGATIETTRDNGYISQAPSPIYRYQAMATLRKPKMVNIEPIMDFELDMMLLWLRNIEPDFVSIGADSKRHNLPEPSSDKVQELIEGLSEFTEVKVKDNLKRIVVIP